MYKDTSSIDNQKYFMEPEKTKHLLARCIDTLLDNLLAKIGTNNKTASRKTSDGGTLVLN